VALATAAGGKFFDPGGPKTRLAFCPLKHIDTDSDLQWAVSWIEVLCELNGLKFTPKRKNAAGDAMLNLRLSASRTLTDFCATIQDEEIREAIGLSRSRVHTGRCSTRSRMTWMSIRARG
jgi:type IV secretion system protein TrbE